MRRYIRLALLLVAAGVLAFCASQFPPVLNPGGLVLYAQSVPVTKTASWTVNPAAQNVTSYTFTLDGGTPVVVPTSACTTTCSTPVVLTTFGNHTQTVVATNTDLSGGSGVTGSSQNSPVTTLAFTLNQAPTAPSGSTIH